MPRWSRYAPDYLFYMTLHLPYSCCNKVLEREGPVKLRYLHSSPPAGVPRNTPGSLPTVECGGCYLWPDTLHFPCNWCGAEQNKEEGASLVYPPSPIQMSYWYYPYQQGVLCGFSIKKRDPQWCSSAPIDGLGIRKSEFAISISAHSQLFSATENGPSKRLFSVY